MDEGTSDLKSAHEPSQGFNATIVIACDTVVALDGEILGKPRDATEAAAMLYRLRGRPHTVYSAITLLQPATDRALTDVSETWVTMRAYTDAEIAEQEYYDNGILMVAMVKAGVELAFETMLEGGIKAESAYYESLHEVPLIANLITRTKLYEMNCVISDTAEYGDYSRGKRVISPRVRKEMSTG